MKTKISKQVTYWFGVVAIGLMVGLSIQFVAAWTEPTAAPPGGNVGAPVNTGGIGQVKEGNMILNSLGLYPTGLTVNGNMHVINGELDVATRDPNTGAIITAHKITGVATPTIGTDAVNKDYVDYVDAAGGGECEFYKVGSTDCNGEKCYAFGDNFDYMIDRICYEKHNKGHSVGSTTESITTNCPLSSCGYYTSTRYIFSEDDDEFRWESRTQKCCSSGEGGHYMLLRAVYCCR